MMIKPTTDSSSHGRKNDESHIADIVELSAREGAWRPLALATWQEQGGRLARSGGYAALTRPSEGAKTTTQF